MVNSLWFKWKKLRLPWRKSFLVGEDLAGNTFWEFKDVMNAARFRRIVRFDPKTHYSDVKVTREYRQKMQARSWTTYLYSGTKGYETLESQLTYYLNAAQWHQWLRHVREHPPSIQEQEQDLVRQAQIKKLARLADERWASKASFLDKPKTQQQPPTTQINEATLNQLIKPAPAPAEPKTQKVENPWTKEKKANPGEEWQPEAWSPSSKR
ncbi:hypothetical protein PDIG_73850 [Penicillium digitatum PHI26]|uniref:Uncharacterized protein n=2 Tax=Penicillium digitatum TaxID=36651 RepID=K9G1F7_PEND2|nr:hypothetical protein PDIP_44330 [Penicillium digitatum Pd1]EKV07111.1 hypothetical protein PDIG_73850 [Penicillium digitatum PHI26]EKV14389.1 hypothetical protein PDIP_44330 [Penicillium digitatum Pd1]